MLDSIKDFFEQYGSIGLFFNAFFDGFIIPLPPDFLLSTLALQGIGNPTVLALICSIGSVIGGCIGYCVGRFGGRPLIDKFVPKNYSRYIDKFETLFNKYGKWAIVIDAFTPIPYKALTWGCGILKFNPIVFALVSFPVRTVRYVLVANTASFIGEQMRHDFEKTVLVLTVVVVAIASLIYYLKNRKKAPVANGN